MKSYPLFRKFARNEGGYIAVVFGLLALPIMGIIGGAVDYRNTGQHYANLRAAAEAAAIAVARSEFKPDRAADPDEDPTVLMNAVFSANFENDPTKFTYVTPTLVEVNNTEKTVTVSAVAGAKTALLQIIGFSVFDISVQARAGAVLPSKRIDLHFVIDMSPSMGAPADGTAPPLTAGGPAGGGCYFMCHDNGATIRAAGKIPKFEAISARLAAADGFIQVVQDAADNNAPPLPTKYHAHSFDHAFYQQTFFSNVNALVAQNAFNGYASGAGYTLGTHGTTGGTDLKISFEQLHTYLSSTNPPPNNSRRIIIIISDGMHSRAPHPFDPAVCTTLKGDGDVFTLFVNNPETVYDNPNLTYIVPNSGGTRSAETWDWTVLVSGGKSDYGYYSGLNNAALLMKKCASTNEWAFEGETQTELNEAIDAMAEAIIAPEIRVIN